LAGYDARGIDVVKLHFIRPGMPTEKAYVESFNLAFGRSASTRTGSRPGA